MLIEALLRNRERSTSIHEDKLSMRASCKRKRSLYALKASHAHQAYNLKRCSSWNLRTEHSPLSKSQVHRQITPSIRCLDLNPEATPRKPDTDVPDSTNSAESMAEFLRREKRLLLNQFQRLKGLIDLGRNLSTCCPMKTCVYYSTILTYWCGCIRC